VQLKIKKIMKILVAGSTGQLGFTIVKKLSTTNHSVYALHRKSSDISPLKKLGNINLMEGDLTDHASLRKAVSGMDVVISTVNTAAPVRPEDNFDTVDLKGNQALIKVSKDAGVKQFIYTSAIGFGNYDNKIPIARVKRLVEKSLIESGLNYTIFQSPAFMDIYFAFLGTDIVLKGTEVHTLNRPFKFSNNFFKGIKKDIETKNRFNYIGRGKQKVSFIAVDDVAQFHVNAVGNEKAYNRIIQIGGPEALSALDVKKIFEELMGKPLKSKPTPALVMKIMSKILGLFNKQAANIMALNYAGAKQDSIVPDANKIAGEFDVRLTSAREFIKSRLD
jgi:uncharacterized protein YbjT (DUF2867 family)